MYSRVSGREGLSVKNFIAGGGRTPHQTQPCMRILITKYYSSQAVVWAGEHHHTDSKTHHSSTTNNQSQETSLIHQRILARIFEGVLHWAKNKIAWFSISTTPQSLKTKMYADSPSTNFYPCILAVTQKLDFGIIPDFTYHICSNITQTKRIITCTILTLCNFLVKIVSRYIIRNIMYSVP